MNAPATLGHVRDEGAGDSYPRGLLARCDNALVLFAAAFLGRQDAYWVADAGVRATCVDTDQARLAEMEALYPRDWQFIAADAFAYAEGTDRRWDLVSVDCPSDAFEKCASLVGTWCSIAEVAVVLGNGLGVRVVAPDGWRVTETRKRSDFVGGTYWAVLEPV